MSDIPTVYELTGQERKEEVSTKVPCGVIVSTRYYLNDVLVREDQDVQVDPKFISEAFTRL